MSWSFDDYMAYARRIVHDTSNPVNAISMHLELMELLLKDNAKGAEVLARSRNDLQRIIGTVRRGLYLPDGPVSKTCSPVSLSSCIRHSWSLIEARDAQLGNAVSPQHTISASESFLQQALIQLLANAALFGDGKVWCAAEENVLRISNRVHGSNLDPERWFEHGYSTLQSEGRLGLGLSIAQGALESFANLEIHADGDSMCTVIVTFSDRG